LVCTKLVFVLGKTYEIKLSMMKKILIGVGVVLLLLISYAGYKVLTTKSHSPEAVMKFSTDQIDMNVKYCRPYKKGRVIFGELVPYGTYWRTGANEPSIISFSKDVIFGGVPVKAGSYRIYCVPGLEEWEVSLNTELEEWGYYEPDYNLDIAKVKIPSIIAPCCVEQFLMEFKKEMDGASLTLTWDDVAVVVPITY